jgi:hypothetical protein
MREDAFKNLTEPKAHIGTGVEKRSISIFPSYSSSPGISAAAVKTVYEIMNAAQIIDPRALDDSKPPVEIRRRRAMRKARDIVLPLVKSRNEALASRDELLDALSAAHEELKTLHTLAGNFHQDLQAGIDRRAELLARHGRGPNERTRTEEDDR